MKVTIYRIKDVVKLKNKFLVSILRQKGTSSSTPPENDAKSNFKVCTITDNMIDPCKPEPSVVIIGAGLSGLSAAHRLAQCGLSNFTILEATERPGGRIHSYWLNDVIAEMGCEAIEGACIANPVYNLAAQAGILKPPIRYREYVSDNALHCTSDGRAIHPSVAYVAMQIFSEIKQEANSLYALSCGKKHGSLHEFITLRIQQELKRFPEEQRFDVARILHGSMVNLRFRLGDDLQNVSAENFGSMVHIPGGSAYIPQGFIGILAPLLKDLPDSALRFKKPVTLIKWGTVAGNSKSTPRAVVQCCDGEEYCADYVIVTVSLGVLKEHADKLFCPALPAEKSAAIKKLGFGNADKVFLDYERPFWLWNDSGIRFAWSKDELAKRSDWTKGISGINEVAGSKHVLGANISGPEAVVMEQASDEEVVEKITKLMRQFTGDPCLPYPAAILRSKWSSDPYFCGAYTFLNKESNVGHMCDLSCPVPGNCDPVPPILLFAGEATSAGYHSTVHGALLSGVREAERVVQLTKKFNGPPPKS